MARKSAIRQELFAREYVIDLNATRAAIAAGYSEATAESAGSRLLSNVKVKRLIDSLTSQRASKLEIKADRVLRQLADLADANMLDFMRLDSEGTPSTDFSNLTREQGYAIQEFTTETYLSGHGDEKLPITTVKFKLADKRGPLELLGKHLRLFADKVEVTGLEGLAERMAELRKSDAGS